ncbi:MAG: hypothetical protein LBU60_03470, partial [Clostridiales bacterium]|nr:hypothetical protein [Clostridiales bacterium]
MNVKKNMNTKNKVIVIAGIVLAMILIVSVIGVAIRNGSGKTPPGDGGGGNGGDGGNGVVDITDFSPDGIEARIRHYLPEEEFLEMFPVRFGTQGW